MTTSGLRGRRPSGADNFLKLRRSLDEHIELRWITWDEFAMFVWLCLKANPRSGTLRTSWPTLAIHIGLSANRVEQLCRALRRKRYLWYPPHRGSRGRLIELAIHKFPTADGGYTDLSARFPPTSGQPALAHAPTPGAAELGPGRTDVPPFATELGPESGARAQEPAELDSETPGNSRGSPPGRLRLRKEREREQDPARALRARSPRARAAQSPGRGGELTTPVAIRELITTQPWWSPSTDGRPSSSAAEAGGRPTSHPATDPTNPPLGGARR